jgi:transcriptional antiterminator Rof (Rho-off)
VQLLREQKITPKSKNKVTKRQEVQTLVVSGVETSAHKRTDTITSLQETERGQMSFK